jgi:hypothetical protein
LPEVLAPVVDGNIGLTGEFSTELGDGSSAVTSGPMIAEYIK